MSLAASITGVLARSIARSFNSGILPIRHPYRKVSSYRRMSSTFTLARLPIFDAILRHDPQKTAIVHSKSGHQFSYGRLLQDVSLAAEKLAHSRGGSINGQRIAFFAENGYDYVVTFLAILGQRGIAVPLATSFPVNEVRYILNNSQASMLLSSAKYERQAAEIVADGLEQTTPLSIVADYHEGRGSSPLSANVRLGEEDAEGGGLMLYTSGTTNRPKGVLLSQPTLTAQCLSLVAAWEYSQNDHLLHVLPLHHIHGIINALLAPLFAGSTLEFLFPFNANDVWERLAAPFVNDIKASETIPRPITVFTAVPTIYSRLLATHPDLPSSLHDASKIAIAPENLRLNMSGSAALPTITKSAWKELSMGNVLLERYGMTEAGMALSCGLDFEDRPDGSVGWPLPSVEVRLVDTETNKVIPPDAENAASREGEIQLRGLTVFNEYWRNPEATRSGFVDADDGKGSWFKTGDVAVRESVHAAGESTQAWAKGPAFFIHGRQSVDIIKTGGEKVSALEVERELMNLPQVAEVAVVGLPSDTWGQKVVAVVVLRPDLAHSGKGGKKWSVWDMRRALAPQLAKYKIPQEMRVIPGGLPRNAMGKVNKKSLVKEISAKP